MLVRYVLFALAAVLAAVGSLCAWRVVRLERVGKA
jgi:PPP family 3-phenylpropionic acid transporter